MLDTANNDTAVSCEGLKQQRLEQRPEVARAREVMRAQQEEFQMQVVELHKLLKQQRDIVRTRQDIAAEIIDTYCELPTECVKEG